MLARVVIRPALRNAANYRDGNAKDWKPLEWQGFYSLRRGIATQLAAMTRDPMAAKGPLGHEPESAKTKAQLGDRPDHQAPPSE
jgi:hypothetical protein